MNPLRSFFPAASAIGLLALGASACAQTQAYAPKTRTIHAAVLLLDADYPKTSPGKIGQTAAPYAFQNLDQASGIKPGGWTFTNPLAPGVVTDDIAARYAKNELNDVDNTPQNGALIVKSYAAYWTMRLSQLSDAQLGNYDVLLIAPRQNLNLNPSEREKLRRFVDGGGVLWVDTFGAGPNPSNNLPFAVQVNARPGNDATSDPTSPLLNGPRKVTGSDLTLLSPNANVIGPVSTGLVNDRSLVGEFSRYRGAAWLGNNGDNTSFQPLLASARLGDGAIVVTTGGVAEYLSQGVPTSKLKTDSNLGFRNLANGLGATARAAARLAVNIVSLGGNFQQPAGSSHKLGSAGADPGSPVLSRFTAEGTYGPGDAIKQGVPVGSPVTYKGFLVASIQDVSNGTYRVVVFDSVPGRDLDGDGDPDDGIVNTSGAVQDAWRDTSIGKSLDVVWMSKPLGRISAPVCAESPETALLHGNDDPKYPTDYVLVVDSTGRLNGYNLTPKVQGRLVGGADHDPALLLTPPDASSFAIANKNGDINPPTVYDGIAYIADTVSASTLGNGNSGTPLPGGGMGVGRVWAVKLDGSAIPYLKSPTVSGPLGPWYVGGSEASGTALPAFTASPTIGYIPIQDSAGGLDRVLYAPGYVNSRCQPTFVSLWLGAKGEKPFSIQVGGGSITFTTRAATRGQLPIYNPTNTTNLPIEAQLAPRISITDSNGNPVRVQDYLNDGTPTAADAGTLVYSLKSSTLSQTEWDALNYNVRIDYSIDWGRDPKGLSGNIARGRIILPVDKGGLGGGVNTERILGSIALTPKGTLHLTEGNNIDDPRNPGEQTYWAFREDMGYGAFRCVTKYSLTQNYTQTFGSVTGTNVPATITDADVIQQFIPGYTADLSKPFNTFTSLKFSGGVTVRNGVAYVGINAFRNGVIPVAVLAAFSAEPETPELRVGAALGTNPRITQTDYARTQQDPSGRTPTQSSISWANLNVDKENGIIRIESLAVAQREEISDSISLSQPIGYGSEARPLIYRNPDAEGDRWSPLLWFGLWNGGTIKGAPLVAGSEAFIAADTVLPNLFDNNSLTTSGVVWSVDADHPTTGTFAQGVPSRPWMIQAVQGHLATLGDPTTFQPSPYYRMPQVRGASFEEWKVRLRQTKLGVSTKAFGVAGGDGTVVAWGDQGLYGMGRADFLVADEGRLLRVDSSGNPVANVFANRFSGVGNGGGAAEMRPLVRPVKAYPVGENDLLVVDAGASRVILMDQDGTALRTLDGMILDRQYKPASYHANDPLNFSDPRDAATYEGYVYKGAQEVVTNQGAVEYWVRYIVADSGNGRIVELADRYTVDASTGRIGSPVDINGVAQVGVLTWQSPALDGAARIGTYYNSISRVYIGTLGSGRYVYVAGVSKSRVTRSSAGLDNPNGPSRPSGAGGGAIVVFDPFGGTRVFDRFGLPNLRDTKFLNRAGNYNSSNPASFTNGLPVNTPAQNDRPFSGLMAVTAQTYVDTFGNAMIRAMATDEDAVYEFTISSATLGDANADPTKDTNDKTGATSLAPTWMLNEAAYSTLRLASNVNGLSDTNARYFRPMYARRLDSGEILVVNGYRGIAYDNTPFAGDVSLVDSRTFSYVAQNLGFTSSSLQFELPPLTGVRGIVSPVFADRR